MFVKYKETKNNYRHFSNNSVNKIHFSPKNQQSVYNH